MLALTLAGAVAVVAAGRPAIWDVRLGSPVSALPDEFVDPACGTNGGPPGLRIEPSSSSSGAARSLGPA